MDTREDDPAGPLGPGVRLSSALSHLQCARCGATADAGRAHQRCGCGGPLLARYDLAAVNADAWGGRPPGMWRYRELLPVQGEPVSLGEPETPLLFAPSLSERWGVEVFVKDEGTLPGGTFKARGAAVGVSRAAELGVVRVVMPSAGNAGGAWSLYGARAGIDLTVTMAASAPVVNQVEVRSAGARLELVDGTIADAGRRASEIAAETGAFLAATFSEPYRLEGKKAAWLEVFDALGGRAGAPMSLPRMIVTPVGGGVAVVAAAKAVAEVSELGLVHGPPPVAIGVQADGCAPLVRAFELGAAEVAPWDETEPTIAAGLRVPAPAEGALVLSTMRRSKGAMVAVTDDQIVAAVKLLALNEGVVACPEGAATVAAADTLAAAGGLEGPLVLYNTGSGYKYPEVMAAAGVT